MFCLCFVCVSLVFFYVCQNPKILFSQNKILDFCLTQVLRKQSVCQTQVKHRANIVSHNSAHLQRRWKHVRDSWDTWLPEWFVDSFVFCWWVVLCFIVDSLAFCLWWVSDVFMIHLCLLLCCVYVVLCWFFTSLVCVRLLASDLVPIDEALWVYLNHNWGSQEQLGRPPGVWWQRARTAAQRAVQVQIQAASLAQPAVVAAWRVHNGGWWHRVPSLTSAFRSLVLVKSMRTEIHMYYFLGEFFFLRQ